MKNKLSLLLTSILILNCFILKSQCDNFSYQMQETVINSQDVSLNSLEAYNFIRKASFSEDIEELKEFANSSLEFAKVAKNSSSYAETAVQLAISSSETCFCVTGQNFAYRSEASISEMTDLINVANKYIKKAIKAKSLDEAQKSAHLAMEALEAIEIYCKMAVEDALEGQYLCD